VVALLVPAARIDGAGRAGATHLEGSDVISGLYSEAGDAADEVLRDVFRIDISKALDPLDARDFLVIVQRLPRALTGVSRDTEATALRRALATLDVDWPTLSAAARDQVIRAAHQAVGVLADKVLPRVDEIFEVEAQSVVGRTRRTTIR